MQFSCCNKLRFKNLPLSALESIVLLLLPSCQLTVMAQFCSPCVFFLSPVSFFLSHRSILIALVTFFLSLSCGRHGLHNLLAASSHSQAYPCTVHRGQTRMCLVMVGKREMSSFTCLLLFAFYHLSSDTLRAVAWLSIVLPVH